MTLLYTGVKYTHIPLIQPSMIPVDTFRKSLGERGKRLPEQDVEKLMHLLYRLGNALFDEWQGKNKVVINSIVVVHKKDGNACTVYISEFIIYAYA